MSRIHVGILIGRHQCLNHFTQNKNQLRGLFDGKFVHSRHFLSLIIYYNFNLHKELIRRWQWISLKSATTQTFCNSFPPVLLVPTSISRMNCSPTDSSTVLASLTGRKSNNKSISPFKAKG